MTPTVMLALALLVGVALALLARVVGLQPSRYGRLPLVVAALAVLGVVLWIVLGLLGARGPAGP